MTLYRWSCLAVVVLCAVGSGVCLHLDGVWLSLAFTFNAGWWARELKEPRQ